MRRPAVALAILMAAAPLVANAQSADDLVTIDRALAAIYGGYQNSEVTGADWEKPVFSAETAGLIANWHQSVGDELTDLGDYAWFCECQDWDAKAFRWKRRSVRQIRPGRIEVRVHVDIGWGEQREQRLVLVNERGRWLVDDLFGESAAAGIKAELKRESAKKAED